ncbi:inositol 2-dehydrogenase [Cypionkella aquatica]|uniref:Inositol 2-dehydrogenase n=1 Tax=Cypionkella aquatica TaxID=1756042 RepID=A0AA37TQ30_9RHOB|nr:inositol 2-dehydrogenase [Cypionkella aquatica]GLS85829.1 inositol 2-dehydrogenase [Cypionkella aquatica]
MLKIGVLGCGRIGVMHAANIAAHGRAALAGLYDVNGAAADALGAKLGAKVFNTAEAMITSPDVDTVLIATSTATHSDYIEAAIAAGKAVLCEKPIDLDLQRVNLCQSRIKDTKLPVMIGFVRRFDAGHRAARQAMLDGEIGTLHQVVITSRDPGMAPDAYMQVSGGIFRDMTIHDFDLARYMLGEEVETVTATGSRLVNPTLMARLGDYDSVVVTMTTSSGKQAVIINSRQALYGYDQRLELFGDKGMVISENRRAHNMTRHLAGGTNTAAPLLDFFIERYADAFNAEIGSFVDAVEGKAAVEVGFDDGRLALVLAEAAMKSVAEARTVRVSEIG